MQSSDDHRRASPSLGRAFRVSLILKGADAVLEMVGGVLFLVVPPSALGRTMVALTQHELSEDPRDLVASFLRDTAQHLGGARFFGAVYPLSHGVSKILRALDKAYPHARTALVYRTPFELLIATILSAQSTDATVNRVTPVLFARFPDARALAAADPAEVERIIYPTGFYRQKAKTIIAAARALVETFGGEVPRRIEDLVTLPGVGRKTANVVLANCWPRPASNHGIFVDTHVSRASRRLELTKSDDPEEIEQDLCALVPESKWAVFPHQLILLGRGPCNARAPRHEECPLLEWCPTGRKALRRKDRPAASPGDSRRSRPARDRAPHQPRRKYRVRGT